MTSDITPTAMTAEQLAEFLTKAGAGTVSAADIEGDVAAGAPKNEDGTINMMYYFAWLARR